MIGLAYPHKIVTIYHELAMDHREKEVCRIKIRLSDCTLIGTWSDREVYGLIFFCNKRSVYLVDEFLTS